MSENVIKFPHYDFEKIYPENLEELENKTEMIKKIYLEEWAIQFFEDVVSRMVTFKLIDPKENPEDVGLLFETFKAVLYRKAGLDHALHEVSETFYENYRYAFNENIDEYEEEDE